MLTQLVKQVGAEALYAHQEATFEEVQCEARIVAELKVCNPVIHGHVLGPLLPGSGLHLLQHIIG